MQATEALCHLSVTDIKKTFCNVCKNEACSNCTGWNATTVIWLLSGTLCSSISFTLRMLKFQPNLTKILKRFVFHMFTFDKWTFINQSKCPLFEKKRLPLLRKIPYKRKKEIGKYVLVPGSLKYQRPKFSHV